MNNLSINYGKSSLYHDISYDPWTEDHNTMTSFSFLIEMNKEIFLSS